MNKNLHDDIDAFFLDNLKEYAEAPAEAVWSEINKKLSLKKEEPKGHTWKIFSLGAAAVVVCLLIPFILNDVFVIQKPKDAKSVNLKLNAHVKTQPYSIINHNKNFIATSSGKDLLKVTEPAIDDEIKGSSTKKYSLLKTDDTITSLIGLSSFDKLPTKPIEPFITSKAALVNNAAPDNKTLSNKTTKEISLHFKKHDVELIPFFSFDHISGRFIEQYEFDNEHKNDYEKREKPDVSFTGGLLASYNIDKRFSLTSGISISDAFVSISSTAVNALQDDNGVYKFKLATSYGLAEISKTGITPSAGDSLFVSNAMLRLNYISFPALVSFNFGDKKIKWSAHTGVALNKVMSDKVQVEYAVNNNDDNETIDKIEGVRKTFFTLNTGIEAKYSISHSMDISLSPELRYGINSINKGTPVKTYPINYGLSLDLHVKL